MKILLINPYIYDFTAFDLWLRPLGLLYISSVIRKFTEAEIYWIDVLDRFSNGNEISLDRSGRGKYHKEIVGKPDIYEEIPRNYSRYGIPSERFDDLLKNLPEINIVLMTSLMTYWIDGISYTTRKVKEHFPDAVYILGGVIPGLLGEEFPESNNFDHIISGYGEKKILELLKEKGVRMRNFPDFSDPDKIPYPDFDLMGSKKILPLLTSRGCPHDCTYCASGILNSSFLQRSPENILDEINSMMEIYEPLHYIIFDDAFLINKKNRFFKVFNKLDRSDRISFHTPNGLHAKEIDRQTADLMYRSGFKTIRLSFESTGTSILKKSSRKISESDMKSAVENLVNAGYKTGEIECYILFGMHNQNVEELEKTLDFVDSLGIIPRLSYYSPVPGTMECNNLLSKGVINKNDLLYESNKIYFVYKRSGLGYSLLEEFKQRTSEIVLKNRND